MICPRCKGRGRDPDCHDSRCCDGKCCDLCGGKTNTPEVEKAILAERERVLGIIGVEIELLPMNVYCASRLDLAIRRIREGRE